MLAAELWAFSVVGQHDRGGQRGRVLQFLLVPELRLAAFPGSVMDTAVFVAGVGLLGACVGSFLNVVVWRLPQEDPARRSLGGRSHCPHCGALIHWFDNIPVLSWVLLRRRARCCGGRISARYPLVELLTAGLFVLLALWPPAGPPFVQAGASVLVDARAIAAFALHAVFLSLLVALTFIDFDTQLLPDALTKPGMAIGLLGGLWPGLAGEIAIDAPRGLRTLLASGLGLLVGFGVTWLIRALGSRLFRKEAMGFGDVKFLAMIGAFLGWKAALLTMLVGCLAGSVVGGIGMLFGQGARIPFGPYLALGALVAMFAEAPILDFLFVTWPEWQRTHPQAQWTLAIVSLLCLVGLFALLKRRRFG
jgi:leader peptidase (prepilin peptidase)/N-methyltransferase